MIYDDKGVDNLPSRDIKFQIAKYMMISSRSKSGMRSFYTLIV